MTTGRYSDPGTRIDALVLGELSGEDYRQTLAWLEAHPEYWRDCALAFLEEQALAQELSAIAKANRAEWPTGASMEDTDSGSSSRDSDSMEPACGDEGMFRERCSDFGTSPTDSPADDSTADSRQRAGVAPRTQHSLWRWMERLTVLAATLLFGITLGSRGPEWWRDKEPADSATLPATALVGDTSLGGAPRGVSDASSGELPSRLVADYPGADVEAPRGGEGTALANASSSRIVPMDLQPPEVLRELEQRGLIGLETIESLMLMEFEDGASAIVPVQQHRFKSNVFTY